jgi:hypothetical protein
MVSPCTADQLGQSQQLLGVADKVPQVADLLQIFEVVCYFTAAALIIITIIIIIYICKQTVGLIIIS